MKLFLLTFFIGLNLSSVAHAAEPIRVSFEPRLTGNTSPGILLLGAEFSSFAAPKGSLTGGGINMGYHYAIDPQLTLRGTLSQAFNLADNGSLYTGFGAFAEYALSGNWAPPNQGVEWKGKSIIAIKNHQENIWGVHAGLEQYLFSGIDSVYSAPGFSVGGYSKFELFNQEFLGSLSYGSYTAGSARLTGFNFKLQFLLR